MRKLCLSGFRLVALFYCLVAPLFAIFDSLNQDERQQVAPKIAGEIHWIWRNKSLSAIQETIKTWWSTFIEEHVDVVVDNVATTRECVLSKYSTMSTQWTSSYSRTISPSVAESTTAATASRRNIHNDDTLSASTVIGTGQTSSPLPWHRQR